jgi:hypothetical protein
MAGFINRFVSRVLHDVDPELTNRNLKVPVSWSKS